MGKVEIKFKINNTGSSKGLENPVSYNLFSIKFFEFVEKTVPSNLLYLIERKSLEEDFRLYSAILNNLNDEQAYNYLEKNIEFNKFVNSQELFFNDNKVLNYLEKMKGLRKCLLNNHDLVKIHEDKDKAFHYYLFEDYLFSSPDYDFITEHIIYNELIEGKSINAVKREIVNLSKYNKIMKYLELPYEDLFDEKDFE